jgi:predicted DCC family thiol-disulfide oxidoreductase YuxK
MNLDESLPEPAGFPGTDVVIYDGNCQFCLAQVRRLARFDRWSRFGTGEPTLSFISLHDPLVAERFSDLAHDDLMEQMFVVEKGGTLNTEDASKPYGQRRFGGADAIRYLSRKLPILWPAMPILHLPGTARLWRWMYAQVARQRYRWNKDSCESGSCSIHFGDAKDSPKSQG